MSSLDWHSRSFCPSLPSACTTTLKDPKRVENQVPPTTGQAGYLKGIGVLRVQICNLAEGLPAPGTCSGEMAAKNPENPVTPHLSQPFSTFQAAVATGEATLKLHLQLCDLNTLGKFE